MKKLLFCLVILFISINLYAFGGDGLGNHKAKRALNMNNKDVNNVENIDIADVLTMGDDSDCNVYRFSISSPIYVILSYYVNRTSITSITANEQWELICGTTTFKGSFFRVSNDLNGNPNVIEPQIAGFYDITVDFCIADEDVGASYARIAIFINDVMVGRRKTNYYSVQDAIEGLNVSYMGYLNVGDKINAKITSNNSSDLSVCEGSIKIQRTP